MLSSSKNNNPRLSVAKKTKHFSVDWLSTGGVADNNAVGRADPPRARVKRQNKTELLFKMNLSTASRGLSTRLWTTRANVTENSALKV